MIARLPHYRNNHILKFKRLLQPLVNSNYYTTLKAFMDYYPQVQFLHNQIKRTFIFLEYISNNSKIIINV